MEDLANVRPSVYQTVGTIRFNLILGFPPNRLETSHQVQIAVIVLAAPCVLNE